MNREDHEGLGPAALEKDALITHAVEFCDAMTLTHMLEVSLDRSRVVQKVVSFSAVMNCVHFLRSSEKCMIQHDAMHVQT